MNSVFVGGSRRITQLSPAVAGRLDNIIVRGLNVLIGDANGADKAVQKYLASKRYGSVVVFCMGANCRNNVGNWATRNVSSNTAKRGFEYYATKDLRMAEEASYGFMLWDGKSKGTLNNVINLLKQGKKVLVYYSPGREFLTVAHVAELADLLRKCDEGVLQDLDRGLGISGFLRPEPVTSGLLRETGSGVYGSSAG